MALFFSVFGLIFIAELADKSRLAGLFLVGMFRESWAIFWGMTLAYAVIDGAAIVAGMAAPNVFHIPWIKPVVAAIFIAMGTIGLLSGKEDISSGQWAQRFQTWGAFTMSFALIAVSEFGDRTQIACALLAAGTRRPWVVMAGALGALATLNVLTVWLGQKVLKKIPIRTIQKTGSVLFIAFGSAMLMW